jgi:hypothetical protein
MRRALGTNRDVAGGELGFVELGHEILTPNPVRPELVEGLPFTSRAALEDKSRASTSSARTVLIEREV